jgi:hypothetical protein
MAWLGCEEPNRIDGSHLAKTVLGLRADQVILA